MITYPAFIAAMAGRDIDEIAVRAGVSAAVIRDLLAGVGWVAPRADRVELARALDADPSELFRVVSEPGGVDLEPALAAAPSRFVTDPATLRAFDRRAS